MALNPLHVNTSLYLCLRKQSEARPAFCKPETRFKWTQFAHVAKHVTLIRGVTLQLVQTHHSLAAKS